MRLAMLSTAVTSRYMSISNLLCYVFVSHTSFQDNNTFFENRYDRPRLINPKNSNQAYKLELANAKLRNLIHPKFSNGPTECARQKLTKLVVTVTLIISAWFSVRMILKRVYKPHASNFPRCVLVHNSQVVVVLRVFAVDELEKFLSAYRNRSHLLAQGAVRCSPYHKATKTARKRIKKTNPPRRNILQRMRAEHLATAK